MVENEKGDTNIDKFKPQIAHNSKKIMLDDHLGRLLHN